MLLKKQIKKFNKKLAILINAVLFYIVVFDIIQLIKIESNQNNINLP